jgi:hypothetical protein
MLVLAKAFMTTTSKVFFWGKASNKFVFLYDKTSLQGKEHCNLLIPSPCKIHEFGDDKMIKPSYNRSNDFLYVKDHKLEYGGNCYMSYTIHVTHLLQAKELLELNHPTQQLTDIIVYLMGA